MSFIDRERERIAAQKSAELARQQAETIRRADEQRRREQPRLDREARRRQLTENAWRVYNSTSYPQLVENLKGISEGASTNAYETDHGIVLYFDWDFKTESAWFGRTKTTNKRLAIYANVDGNISVQGNDLQNLHRKWVNNYPLQDSALERAWRNPMIITVVHKRASFNNEGGMTHASDSEWYGTGY